MQGMKLEAFEKTVVNNEGITFPLKPGWLKRNRIAVSIAAFIIVLIGLNWFFTKNTDTSIIAYDYYSTPFADIKRSDLTPNTPFAKGMTAFSQQKWKEAIAFFEQIDPKVPVYR